MEAETIQKRLDFSILYLDDNEECLGTTCRMLHKEGYNVIGISSKKQAMHYLRDNSIDIFLFDFVFENYSAEEVISEVRGINNNVAIILVTAYYSEIPTLEMMKKFGVEDYVCKADGWDKLLASLLRLVRFISRDRTGSEVLKQKQKARDMLKNYITSIMSSYSSKSSSANSIEEKQCYSEFNKTLEFIDNKIEDVLAKK